MENNSKHKKMVVSDKDLEQVSGGLPKYLENTVWQICPRCFGAIVLEKDGKMVTPAVCLDCGYNLDDPESSPEFDIGG